MERWELDALFNTHTHYHITDQEARWMSLVIEHNYEFLKWWDRLLDKDQKTYRIKFTALQAAAFYTMWQGVQLPAGDPGTVVVLQLLEIFDKAHKQVKALHA